MSIISFSETSYGDTHALFELHRSNPRGWSRSRLPADDAVPSPELMRIAVNKAIPLLEKGAKGSAKHRKCFTCHNQAIPVLALAEDRQCGFTVGQVNFERQVQHTATHIERGKKNYLDGRGQGGRAISAGYAMWVHEAGGHTSGDDDFSRFGIAEHENVHPPVGADV